MNKLSILFLFILSAVLSTAKAQEIEPEVFRTNKDTRKIELPKANRNFEKINYDLPQAPVKPQEYETEEVDIEVPKLATKINVVTLKPLPLPKLYGNYVKVGFGNYATPYVESFLNNKRSENWSYGLHLKHFSSGKGPVKFSSLSENKASAYAKYFTKRFEFNSSLSYDRDRYNLYGFNQALPVERDTIRQLFQTFAFKAGIKGLNKDSKISYYANFGYFNFRDNYKAKEQEYLTGVGGTYKLDSEKSLRTDAVLSISNYKDSIEKSRAFFQIKPALLYTFGKYKLTAGINAAYTNDTINTAGFHLYPRIHVDVEVMENKLTAFAGMEGEIQKNTFRSFASENPFLQPDLDLRHTNKALELYTGIKGNHAGFNFMGRLGYANYKNLYFFNNSLKDSSEFLILYDKATTVLNLEGDVSYETAEKFRLGLNMKYFNYNVNTLEKAWHRPNFVASFSAGYNLYKKIYINTDIYYISGLTGKNYISGREVKLDGILDANIKVDYKFSNVFSAFLEINNLFSKKYQRYLYYPVKGINVIGGISYSF